MAAARPCLWQPTDGRACSLQGQGSGIWGSTCCLSRHDAGCPQELLGACCWMCQLLHQQSAHAHAS